MKQISVYVHIPFCASKCLYCDFVSFGGCDSQFDDYANSLVKEIQNSYDFLSEYTVSSIFIGGGTPTVLPPFVLQKIINTLTELNMSKDCEFTVEANPETLDLEYIKMLKGVGVNRISMGLQSTDNDMLKKLGRIHTYEKFVENYNNILNAGIENINVDLMFSLPNQTIEDVTDTIEKIVRLEPKHISAYSLIIEPNTPYEKMYESGKLDLPSEDTDREMYELIENMLGDSGYNRYEISNYAQSDYECRHNKVYWQRGDYIGFGLNAHSMINNVRYSNTDNLEEYINGACDIKFEARETVTLSVKEQIEEFMFLGLRLVSGVSVNQFSELFDVSVFDVYGDELNKLEMEKMIEVSDTIRLSKLGMDLANYVMSQFLIDEDK